MAKVIYKFDDIEDKDDLALVQMRSNMHSALWDFSQDVLRQIVKYEDINQLGELPEGVTAEQVISIVELVRERFNQVLVENRVEL